MLLDPKTQGCNLSDSGVLKAIEFIDQMVSAQNNIINSYKIDVARILVDIANYRSRQDIWSNNFIWKCVEKISLLTWWNSFCSSTDLCIIANKILSVSATSVTTERSFSKFSNNHTKKKEPFNHINRFKNNFFVFAHYWRQTFDKNKKVICPDFEVELNKIDKNSRDLSKVTDKNSMSSCDSTSSNELKWIPSDSDSDFFNEFFKQKD